ncbi:S-adenosyl-L-methionine-dependent methyltransferase [Auricularia subglabra TFB-10046 SS5]|nr:S-adenosyl-L-methionine-dependent methyltransferase [Auricularia subglabra TFB-10046 SS5]
MTLQNIRQLLNILTQAVDALEAELKKKDVDFPALDTPISVGSPAELSTTSEEAVKAIDLIVAAAGQLTATVRAPFATLMEASQVNLPAVLQFVISVHVPELLRAAGTDGLHADHIASKAGVDGQKLAHVLRYLATFHIFQEVAPNVFANNRISSLLDTGNAFEAITDDPLTKHSGSNGVAALILVNADLTTITTKLTEHYTAPDTKFSREPDNTVASTAFGVRGKTFFAWLEQPENRKRAMMYGFAMRAAEFMEVPTFDWASLRDGSLVVDVGGGIGNVMMSLYKTYPSLKFEIQDRIQSIWSSEFPEALPSGRVSFRTHNFLEPQPVKDAAVFFLRNILHNWPDAYITRVLRHLRDSATPETKLLIVDRILPYATPGTSCDTSGIQGVETRAAPPPLLANFGRATSIVSALDLGVQTTMNGLERTIGELVDVTSRAGWTIERVTRPRGDISVAHILAVPGDIHA